jgi:hypothetical protein
VKEGKDMLPQEIKDACNKVTMARLLREAREEAEREARFKAEEARKTEEARRTEQYLENNAKVIREEALRYFLKYIEENAVEEDEIRDFRFTPEGLAFILCEDEEELEVLRSEGLEVRLECAPLRDYCSHIWPNRPGRLEINQKLTEWRINRYQ